MALNVEIVHQNSGSSPSTVDFTHAGVGTIEFAIIIASYAESLATVKADAGMCVGVYDGTSEHVLHFNSEDAQTTTDSHRKTNSTECLALATPGTASNIWAASASTITDGIRLTFSSTQTTGIEITVVLFSGDIDAVIDNPDILDTTDTDISVTGVGFEADAVFAIASRGMDDIDGGSSVRHGIGWVHNGASITNRSVVLFWRSGRTTSAVNSHLSTSEIGTSLGVSGNIDRSFVIDSFNSDGYNINTPNPGENTFPILTALAKSGNTELYIGTDTTPTATGNKTHTITGDFTPKFVMILGTRMPAVDTDYSDSNSGSFSIGVFTADDEYCYNIAEEDGQSTSDTQSLVENKALIIEQDDGSGSNTANFVSFGNNEFVLNHTEVDATARQLLIFAIGESSSGGTGTVDETLDALTLSSDAELAISGTSTPTLAGITLSSDAELDISATTAIALDDLSLSSSATLDIEASLSATLGDLSLVSQGELDISGDLSTTLDDLSLSSQGGSGVFGLLSATLDALVSSSQGELDIKGSASPTLGELALSSSAQLPLDADLLSTLDDLTLLANNIGPINGSLSTTLESCILSSTGVQGTVSIPVVLGEITSPRGEGTVESPRPDGSITIKS